MIAGLPASQPVDTSSRKMSNKHSIGDVSRISGIPRDLLRMWERRYSFPCPARDEKGDRQYSNEQLEKLVLIRQLIDQGKRPGKLVKMQLTQLRSLQQEPQVVFDADQLIGLVASDNTEALGNWLHSQLYTRGLRAFIHQIMAPASKVVGDAWAQGTIQIHEEHLFTELVKGLVRHSLAEQIHEGSTPRIMLTTAPGERHSLGLMMVEALLRLGGAKVFQFGTEMPVRDIKTAAESHHVDIIGLSFSSGYRVDDAVVMLSGLRQLIDPAIVIWAGGAALDKADEMPVGVFIPYGLQGVETALADWKSA